jgi:flagellar motor switch protein FliN/FliY
MTGRIATEGEYMAGGEQIGQNEIEEMLKQAAAGPKPPPAAPSPAPPPRSASEAASLAQDDIEALLKQATGAPARPATTSSKPAAPPTAPKPPPSPVVSATPSSRSTSDDIQYLIAQAEQALASVDSPVESSVAGLKTFELKDLSGSPPSAEKATIELLRDVELDLRIELGRTHMYLEDVLKLRRGSVVALDKLAGDPVDIYVNGRLVARGEVLVLNNNFSVRVAQLISSVETDVA